MKVRYSDEDDNVDIVYGDQMQTSYATSICDVCNNSKSVLWTTCDRTPIVDGFYFTGLLCLRCDDIIEEARAGDEEAINKLKVAML